MTVPSKYAAGAQNKCAVAARNRYAAVQNNCAVAARNSRPEGQNNKDAVKLLPADCMLHPGLQKAAGSRCSESCPASLLNCPNRRNSDGLESCCRNWRWPCRYKQWSFPRHDCPHRYCYARRYSQNCLRCAPPCATPLLPALFAQSLRDSAPTPEALLRDHCERLRLPYNSLSSESCSSGW